MRTRYRLIWIGLLYSLSLCFFLFQGGKSSLMLFVILNLLLIYIGTGYFSGIRKVSGVRQVHQQSLDSMNITAAASAHISLEIKLPGMYPIPYINIEETLVRHNGEILKYEGSVVPGFRNKGTWHYEIPQLRRGEYQFSVTKCTSYDVFGLLPHYGKFEEHTQITVLPPTVTIMHWNEMMRGNRGQFSSVTSTKQIRESSEQGGIRDYIYGDRLSRVHWNATARTGQWKSKDFEREALPRTIVLLDRFQSNQISNMELQRNQFELAVSVTASLLQDGFKKASAMGLLSCGSEAQYFNPTIGLKQHTEMMKHLTTVDCDGTKPISDMFRHLKIEFTPNSFLLLVTSATIEQLQATLHMLSKKGYAVAVFYIASPSAASELARLRQAGYQIYIIPKLEALSYIAEGSGVG